jgi:hypothetical protein
VRFHYGHPDVWDKLWAISCGGVAKASRTLHVSEDIFGGFNVILRGGTIDYAEFIHCGKGRDMGFIAVAGFETKISAGAAVTAVSRDMLRLMRSFDIFRLMSFYSSMAGFYVTTLMSMWSVYLFTLCNVLLAIMDMESYEKFEYAEDTIADVNLTNCARRALRTGARRALEGAISLAMEVQNKTEEDVSCEPEREKESFLEVDWRNIFSFSPPEEDISIGAGGTAANGLYHDSNGGASDKQVTARYAMATYNSAQFLHLGMLMMFPLFLEQSVQRSVWYAMAEAGRMLASLSFMFYPFSMQTKGHNFGFAVNYGRAGYVATGRGYQIDTKSMVTLFASYGPSHIYYGSEIVAMLCLYEQWKAGDKDFMSTWSVWSVGCALVFSPWLFNPQALHHSTLFASWDEWTKWIYRGNLKPSLGDGSWTKWATKRLSAKRAASLPLKIQILCRNLLTKVLYTIACAEGLRLKRHQSTVLWHTIFMVGAIVFVVFSSIYLAFAVRMFEAFMQRMNRIRFLPIYTFILLGGAYLMMAMVLLLFEHGSWQGVRELYRQKNVWLLMTAAIAMQAGLVQVLGSLSDKMRFETKLDMSMVQPSEGDALHEGGIKGRLARALRVSVADITLKMVSTTEVKQETLDAMKTPEQRLADRLRKQKKDKGAKMFVTEVTATIITSQRSKATRIKVELESRTASDLAGVLGNALGTSTTLQSRTVVSNLDEQDQSKMIMPDILRRRLLAYAQFWQRIADMGMAMFIFAVLTVLSFLPILEVQTSILFNRAFADILNRKIHKQELLDDLYTPGIFVDTEADPDSKKGGAGGSAAGRAITRMRRASLGTPGGVRKAAPTKSGNGKRLEPKAGRSPTSKSPVHGEPPSMADVIARLKDVQKQEASPQSDSGRGVDGLSA